MGNAPSHYESTDWPNTPGQSLTSSTQTIDGSSPTSSHVRLTLVPRVVVPFVGQQLPVVGQLHASREYEVRGSGDGSKSGGSVLFTTRKVDALEQGFDLIRGGGGGEGGEVVLRVDSTFSNRQWHIYQINDEVFEGQHPDPEPTKRTGDKLYRKASVDFGKGDVTHGALVHMFQGGGNGEEGEDVETVLRVERCRGGMTPRWHFQTMLPGAASAAAAATDGAEEKEKGEEEGGADPKPTPPQLVSYWKWEGSPVPLTMDDRITMDLAQKSDVALHVVLAVLSTIERSSVKAEYSG